MVTSKDMRCGMCFQQSVNKIKEDLFVCGSCGQKYPQHLINYGCPDCNLAWRIDKNHFGDQEGWYYIMSMNYNFIYEHTNKRCPDCSNTLKHKRKKGLHPLLFE